jgi:hypothetical protein
MVTAFDQKIEKARLALDTSLIELEWTAAILMLLQTIYGFAYSQTVVFNPSLAEILRPTLELCSERVNKYVQEWTLRLEEANRIWTDAVNDEDLSATNFAATEAICPTILEAETKIDLSRKIRHQLCSMTYLAQDSYALSRSKCIFTYAQNACQFAVKQRDLSEAKYKKCLAELDKVLKADRKKSYAVLDTLCFPYVSRFNINHKHLFRDMSFLH